MNSSTSFTPPPPLHQHTHTNFSPAHAFTRLTHTRHIPTRTHSHPNTHLHIHSHTFQPWYIIILVYVIVEKMITRALMNYPPSPSPPQASVQNSSFGFWRDEAHPTLPWERKVCPPFQQREGKQKKHTYLTYLRFSFSEYFDLSLSHPLFPLNFPPLLHILKHWHEWSTQLNCNDNTPPTRQPFTYIQQKHTLQANFTLKLSSIHLNVIIGTIHYKNDRHAM